MSNLPREPKTPISSSKCKSVFLHGWWLIKVENESKLGVGGLVNRERLGTRGMRLSGSASTGKRHYINTVEYDVFCSRAIAKRHDSNTLEAIDGVTIMISGCIDKSRTLSYGFPPEVCDVFCSGFPFAWKDYASKSSHDEHATGKTKQPLPLSFDDLPVTQVRDLLLMSESDSRALTSIILKDLLKHTEHSHNQSVSPIKPVSANSTETEVDHSQDDDASLSNPTQKITEEGYENSVDSQLNNAKETEGGGSMLGGKQSMGLPGRYSLRSKRKSMNA